jgi:molybdopterin-guanine dinucleotide biosynthesis protein
MAIIVIGGHSRNVGKTSVVAGLIAALSSHNWTAFKVTQFGHGRCSLNGKPCHCATSDHTWAISEEKDRSGKSDSSRFLVAGAKRSFWVRTEQGRLAEAVPTIARRLAESENAILESNSILKFIQPDLYISVLDPAVEDFKASALSGLGRADALIVNADHSGDPQWKEITLNTTASRPLFRIQPPPYVTAELVEFVQTKLGLLSSPSRLS